MKLLNRKRKPKMVQMRTDHRTYHIGGYWGDRIEWSPTDQFKTESYVQTVVGWKTPLPRVGDVLEGDFTKGRARFVFSKITRAGDPPDMFFGEVMSIGYVHELDGKG